MDIDQDLPDIEQPKREPFVMPTHSFEFDPSINVDKIRAYLADLDDEEFMRKRDLGK